MAGVTGGWKYRDMLLLKCWIDWYIWHHIWILLAKIQVWQEWVQDGSPKQLLKKPEGYPRATTYTTTTLFSNQDQDCDYSLTSWKLLLWLTHSGIKPTYDSPIQITYIYYTQKMLPKLKIFCMTYPLLDTNHSMTVVLPEYTLHNIH